MPSYIKVNKLAYSYPSSTEVLFENLDLNFQDSTWYTLTGANGSGKTTLVKLLSGELKPEAGSIEHNVSSTTYIEQNPKDIPSSIWSSFYSDDNEKGKLFSMLGIKEEMLYRYDTLSGGEKKRIQISSALADEPDLLILDEPTNHLDDKTKKLLLSALKIYKGIGIIISHDRTFASALAPNTIILKRETGKSSIIIQYALPLTAALDAEKSRTAYLAAQALMTKRRLKNLSLQLQEAKEEVSRSKGRLSKAGIDAKDHDAKGKIDAARLTGKDRSASNKVKRLNEEMNRAASDEGPKARKSGFSLTSDIAFTPDIVLYSASIKAGAYTLSHPDIIIRKGEKVSIEGDNGAGKSLIIKEIVRQYGSIITYIPQEIDESTLQLLQQKLKEAEDDFRGVVLSTFFRLGGEINSVKDNIQEMSPGEIKKLLLSFLIEEKRGYLVLDELTNHLDIHSIMMLEEVLKESNISLIFVSHDKAFRENIKTNTITVVRDGASGSVSSDLQ